MTQSGVRCPHVFLIAFLLSVVGCTSQEGESFSDKAVSIDLVEPLCAEPGAVSGYIEGNGFGAENVTVTVGGIEAEVLTATGHDASFVVPENVPPGPIEVVVTNPGGRIATINWVTCITDLEVARIEVTPAALVLTKEGETYQLAAQAYNASDQLIPAEFTWASLDPADVEVGSMGLVEAMAPIGSAQITAEAQGVTSSPAVVTLARPVAGAIFVNDNQVVEGPSFDGEPEEFDVGSQVRLTLEGIAAPNVGDILLPQETLSVGGRVAEVQEATPGVFLVALEIIPLDEMYEEFSIDETFELSAADALVGEQVAQLYDVVLQPDGSYLFTLKPDATLPKAATGTRALGPFQCTEIDQVIGVPLTLASLPGSFSIKPNLSLVTRWDSDPATEDRIAVKGSLSGKLGVKVTVTVALNATITCSGELFQLRIPVFGIPLLSGGGFVPVGVGIRVGGKLTEAQVGFEVTTEVQATVEAGIQRPVGQDADPYLTGDVSGDWMFDTILPDPNNPTAQLRIEPVAAGFVYAELSVGVDLLVTQLKLQTLRAQLGFTQSASLGTIEGQLADPAYKSSYKLSASLGVSLGKDVKTILNLLKVTTALLNFNLSTDLTTSPTMFMATADVATYEPNDTVTFDVFLNPSDVNYLPTIYNIEEVLIFETDVIGGSLVATQVASAVPTASGQADFTLQWTPAASGSIGEDFFALVNTSLLPSLPFGVGTLELGKVVPPAPETICDDMADNDGDGDFDCADADCFGDPVCPEICAGGLDEDDDGDTDCDDPDCLGDPLCSAACGQPTCGGVDDGTACPGGFCIGGICECAF